MIYSSIIESFKNHFGQQAQVQVQAPGRINLIGEHTDYNHGLVLPAAIDCHIHFAIGRNQKDPDSVNVFSGDFDNLATFSLKKGIDKECPGWLHYLQAVTVELKENGFSVSGFNCAFGGNIPIGAGLSSSAALTCGLITALAHLFDWSLPKEKIALIAQAAEHRVGIKCGLMDQYAVLFGEEGKVIQLDCRDLKVDYFPCKLGEHCLLLFNTKVQHQLADTAYNDRRASCERVLAAIQKEYPVVETLRDVNQNLLKNTSGLDPLDVQRVNFVLAENERVRKTTEALKQGRLRLVGNLLYESHQGLSKAYEVSCPELDVLVAFAKKEPAILGARMMGGGFGGCTINLVKTNELEKVKTKILAAYQQTTGIIGEAYSVNIGNGVRVL